MPSFSLSLSVAYSFLPGTPTVRTSQVMDQFGITFEQGEHHIVTDLLLESQQIILFTGESGSGKTSLLKETARSLTGQGERVVSLDELSWPDSALVDVLPCDLDQGLALLALCGLGEARFMLRRPSELSDGQRYRFRLALALAHHPQWIVADEFTATLDRPLARIIASNLSRLALKYETGFLLATTHEDLSQDMNPDLHVRCRLNGTVDVVPRDGRGDVKKKRESPPNAGSPPPPSPTGRTSLGGIIAATTSG